MDSFIHGTVHRWIRSHRGTVHLGCVHTVVPFTLGVFTPWGSSHLGSVYSVHHGTLQKSTNAIKEN